jgi:hypothetical protein
VREITYPESAGERILIRNVHGLAEQPGKLALHRMRHCVRHARGWSRNDHVD